MELGGVVRGCDGENGSDMKPSVTSQTESSPGLGFILALEGALSSKLFHERGGRLLFSVVGFC